MSRNNSFLPHLVHRFESRGSCHTFVWSKSGIRLCCAWASCQNLFLCFLKRLSFHGPVHFVESFWTINMEEDAVGVGMSDSEADMGDNIFKLNDVANRWVNSWILESPNKDAGASTLFWRIGCDECCLFSYVFWTYRLCIFFKLFPLFCDIFWSVANLISSWERAMWNQSIVIQYWITAHLETHYFERYW